ncbi:MAG: PH domain-containing protein [Actinomycetota bacterium]|nr:PH domain-containing protein [Actinomycetota bacterium]
MIYSSKKDAWLVLTVWIAILLPFLLGIYNLAVPTGNTQAGGYLLSIGTLTAALLLLLTYPLYYEITSSRLIVRSGIMRSNIPLSSIEEVRPTRNPLSAPAWSLDRLRIDYKKDGRVGFMLVSPEDKTQFMRDLAETVPDLEMRGERVLRRAGSRR